MTNSHGHVTIIDRRPPQRSVEVIGHIRSIVQDVEPQETHFSRVNIEPEDKEDGVVAEVEAKVVKARRGRRPTVTTEVAETA